MSHLIARLLLSMLVFPLGGLVYTVVFVVHEDMNYNFFGFRARDTDGFVTAGIVSWALVACYWLLLWRKSVRWTSGRVGITFAASAGVALAGMLLATLTSEIDEGFAAFVGTSAAILLWLVATVGVWRETPSERAERTSASTRDAVVCPTCGYNLTGLKEPRCPECGSQFTLDQLLASQPSRAGAELVE